MTHFDTFADQIAREVIASEDFDRAVTKIASLGWLVDRPRDTLTAVMPNLAHAFIDEVNGYARNSRLGDLRTHLQRQQKFSEATFGPGARTEGVLNHIRKELDEVQAKPDDIEEWIDVVLLAFDGAMRAGHTPAKLVRALLAKQAKNESRQWPDWRTLPEDSPIEHIKTIDTN